MKNQRIYKNLNPVHTPEALQKVFKHAISDGDEALLSEGYNPSLEPVEELSAPYKNAPICSLIEGDNISSLFSLQATHSEKIDAIYIDPPYNTGKSSFTYYDRNQNWISFMRIRLLLARALLKQSGTIFISINDKEQAHLRILMDEIFGEKNFIANMIWQNSSKSGSSKINLNHEYVLCYSRNSSIKTPKWKTARHTEQIDEMYSIVDQYVQDLPAARKKLSRYVNDLIKTDTEYTWLKNYTHIRLVDSSPQIYYTVDLSVPGRPNERLLADGTHLKELPDRAWQTAERIDSLLSQNLIDWKDGRPYQISPLDRKHKTGVSSVLPKLFTRNGKEELKKIFGTQSPFDFPKPVNLIKTLLSYSTGKDAVILDFFAGSGTTGQAVAELNAEDGGIRETILMTNNVDHDSKGSAREHSIAEQVTSVRLTRAFTGEGWADGKVYSRLPAQLHYYKVRMVSPDSSESLSTLTSVDAPEETFKSVRTALKDQNIL